MTEPIGQDLSENRQFASFEHKQVFFDTLGAFLSVDLDADPASEDQSQLEGARFAKLSGILDSYQEQAHLMDPFLDQMVLPAVNAFRAHAKKQVSSPGSSTGYKRVSSLCMLIYWYTKTRGYKTIIRFFPHQVEDLSIALGYLTSSERIAKDAMLWHVRYTLLLWLSLICIIPFDLARFDSEGQDESTASKLEQSGKLYLGKAGVERESAAFLLARLYTRQDASSQFPAFLAWATAQLASTPDSFMAIGVLQVLCEVTQSRGSQNSVATSLDSISKISQQIDQTSTLASNTLVRKWLTKLSFRVALANLKPRPRSERLKGRTLKTDENSVSDQVGLHQGTDFDVPDSVEETLGTLFAALQDRDTTVRWSAAKGLAKVSERLPADFVDQVFETILGLFAIHGPASAIDFLDIPASAESTWHGTCLACAKFARRDLISRSKLPDLIQWLCKALYFDVRKGAHSVGSSVRDAAAYVLWSLARAQDVEGIRPFAIDLARRLAVVSLFDREIHIRRAASAAFQENVGRMGVFPHGIDVLRKTDFYAVSVRRNAFLTAAPQVAEHLEYRSFLIDHLLHISIKHWDPAVRGISASSLRELCMLDLSRLGPDVVASVTPLLKSSESTDIHGALLTLSEIAVAYRESGPDYDANGLEVFKCLANLPLSTLTKYRNELILEATCRLVHNTVSLSAVKLPDAEKIWRPIVDKSLKHHEVFVQEAAASAMAALSQFINCEQDVQRAVKDFPRRPPSEQQSIARMLGVLSYSDHPHGVNLAVKCLLDCVKLGSSGYSQNLETRRNAYLAMTDIINDLHSHTLLGPKHTWVRDIVECLIVGLEDYTIDERGDVGSWVRMACLRGLGSLIQILTTGNHLRALEAWLPEDNYHRAIGGILKQAVERLDVVRQEAGKQLILLLRAPLPAISSPERWSAEEHDFILHVFLGADDSESWGTSSTVFSNAVTLLGISRYRKQVLNGLLLSIGSKNESTQNPASSSLKTYASSLPVSSNDNKQLDLKTLVRLLLTLGKEHYTTNQLYIPVLLSLDLLVDSGIASELSKNPSDLQLLRDTLNLASRNVDKFKNVQRILTSMKLVMSMLSISALRPEVIPHMASFLGHRFPTVRSASAETLYVTLQAHEILPDDDEAEDLLLETAWSSNASSDLASVPHQIASIVAALEQAASRP